MGSPSDWRSLVPNLQSVERGALRFMGAFRATYTPAGRAAALLSSSERERKLGKGTV
jgi:hypothetical protein